MTFMQGENETYDDDEFPLDLGQRRTVSYHHLVTCTDHGKSVGGFAFLVQIGKEFRLPKIVPLLGIAMVHDHGNGRSPFLKLGDPVRQSAKGCNNEMWAKVVFLLAKQANDADSLDRFSCLGQF